jgi:hypothetical protein
LQINVTKFRWQTFGEVYKQKCESFFQALFKIPYVVSFDSERYPDPVRKKEYYLFCAGERLMANYFSLAQLIRNVIRIQSPVLKIYIQLWFTLKGIVSLDFVVCFFVIR